MATNTYVALDVKTVTTAVPSITFTSIPSTYTDLVLVSNISQSNGYMLGRVGSSNTIDTGSNYSRTYLLGNGSTATSARSSNVTEFYMMSATSTSQFAPTITHFQNYSNTTTNKTFLSRSNDGSAAVEAAVFLWRSTAAINTISIIAPSGNIAVGSTFTLYGISSAGDIGTKATGGTITQDATHTYHTFSMSGNFVPNQSLTADILVVAGGGAGGQGAGGGGGAGGVLGFASQSLTAQRYTVTVGGGGTGGAGIPVNGSNSQFGSLTASVGGGRGAYYVGPSATPALTGGSGGGGGYDSLTGAAGTSGQGNAGGNAAGNPNYGCGGGGGAGAVGGSTSTAVGGNGGAGVNTYTNATWLSTGLSVTGMGVGGYIAGGGGGGSQHPNTATISSGGSGGGGAGASGAVLAAVSGIANTGSGGGGGASGIAGTTSGNGGSGIVIIRYAN
jgi:hypothetical protein